MTKRTKILVLSDIHANLTALESVLKDAGKVDEVWCLGDLVGYGPDPNECIERIMNLPRIKCVIGNHDAACLGKIDTEAFNPDAARSAEWTRSNLRAENLKFLEDLPEKIIAAEKFTLVHGSPRNPIWEYLLDAFSAHDNFDEFDTQVCLVGHTHLPIGFFTSDLPFAILHQFTPNEDFPITAKSILNPGSVGQPRDHNPFAAYALLDPVAMTWKQCRVEYDYFSVMNRIMDAGLPGSHAARLAQGW